jgi:hypothetical protein
MKALSRPRIHEVLGLLLAFSLYSCADDSENPQPDDTADGGDGSEATADGTTQSSDGTESEGADSDDETAVVDDDSSDGAGGTSTSGSGDTNSDDTNSDVTSSESASSDVTSGDDTSGVDSDVTSGDGGVGGENGEAGAGGAGGSNSGGAGAGAGGSAGAGGLAGSGGSSGNNNEPSVDARCAEALPDALAGAGSADDPYLLCVAEQLRLLGGVDYPLDAAYALGDDLDASTLAVALPTLGEGGVAFSGSLDGQGHVIVGLTATLFESIDVAGQVLDLRLSSDVDASMESTSWGLLTKNNGGTVRGVEGSGTFLAADHVGILIGTNQGLVEDCWVGGSMTSQGAHVGGLLGVNLGTVRRSGSTVTVVGGQRVGGLVGRQSAPGVVEECYALGDVTGNQYVGGLIGTVFGGEILNSYARSPLVTAVDAGGLAGDVNVNAATITNCYAASGLSGEGAEGLVGLVIGDSSTVTNSYFLDTATGSVGTALSAEQMMLPASFSDWDFDAVWEIEAAAAFPSLHFQSEP